jgi:hypothetical protein
LNEDLEDFLSENELEVLTRWLWKNEIPRPMNKTDDKPEESWMDDDDDQDLVNSLDNFELSNVIVENLKPIQR